MIRLSQLSGRPDLSIGFIGFHRGWHPVRNTLALYLAENYSVICAECDKDEVPEILFYSVFDAAGWFTGGNQEISDTRYKKCVKIFACEENMRPPWAECHYAVNADRVVDPRYAARHLWWPIWANYVATAERTHWRMVVKPPGYDAGAIRRRKTKFCNFVYSNPAPPERRRFFELLSKYKHVDSGGALLNNIGGRVVDKCSFLADYKFTIAFENSRFPGYLTEKMLDAWVMDTVPIYWGDRGAATDFNPRSFVDANEPEGTDLDAHLAEVVERVIWLDTHDADYEAMLAEPWLPGNKIPECCGPDYLVPFMDMVLGSRLPVLPGTT
jgi:hypothetical protein